MLWHSSNSGTSLNSAIALRSTGTIKVEVFRWRTKRDEREIKARSFRVARGSIVEAVADAKEMKVSV